MNNEYIEGFFKTAAAAGLSQDEAIALLKSANDPSAPPPMGAGISAPPPGALGGGQPPLPGGDPGAAAGGPPPGGDAGGSGIPPEIEQLIQSLPPEVLQQLLMEIEQEMGGQGGPPGAGGPPPGAGAPPPGAGGSPPDAGGPPPPHHGGEKQGSVMILSKTAEYAAGFFEEAAAYGLNQRQANDFYKYAVSLMERAPIDPALLLNSQEKQAQHYEGFVKAALDNGFSVRQAQEAYTNTFVNK